LNLDSGAEPGITVEGWKHCPFDYEKPFFSAVEINYELLITPIGLLTYSIPISQQHQMYFSFNEQISQRPGPALSALERSSTVYPVSKGNFLPTLAAVSPPIVFQRRVTQAQQCLYSYPNEWISDQHARAVKQRCAAPRQCEAEVLSDASSLMSCLGAPQTEGTFFGLNVTKFQGAQGFSEFLYSLTDNSYLPRSGELLPTVDFVDSQTTFLLVLMVFFSPELGITTVMQVEGHLEPAQGAVIDVLVDHFSILSDRPLMMYFVVQLINMVFVIIFVVDMFRTMKRFGDLRKQPPSLILMFLFDFIVPAALTIFVALRLVDRFSSEAQTRRTVGNLSTIPWDDFSISPTEKKNLFLAYAQNIMTMIDYNIALNSLALTILLMILIRVIMATSIHPRLALLKGTIARCLDDMWHTFLLVITISYCFACIASWRFGNARADFVDIETTLRTQFLMLFGNFQEDWTDSYDMIVYTVLFMAILFLLIINFVLAIIVEAYMKVRESIEENETELEFFSDVFYSSSAMCKRFIFIWPTVSVMCSKLETRCALITVGFTELEECKMFASDRSLTRFISHYRTFEFLFEKKKMKSVEEQMVVDLEGRMAYLLGRPPTTVQQRLLIPTEKAMKNKKRKSVPSTSHSRIPNDNGDTKHMDLENASITILKDTVAQSFNAQDNMLDRFNLPQVPI